MLDVLTLYVSGFWPWLGITIGLAVIIKGIATAISAIFIFLGRK